MIAERPTARRRPAGGWLPASLLPSLVATALCWPAESAASGRLLAAGPGEIVVSQRIALHALVLGERVGTLAGQSRLRMVHGSSAIEAIDIYVTPPGAGIGDPAVAPLARGVPFGASTDLLSLPPGTYDIRITAAGQTETKLLLPGLGVDAGDVLTLIARDGFGDGGRRGPALVVIDTNTSRSGGVF